MKLLRVGLTCFALSVLVLGMSGCDFIPVIIPIPIPVPVGGMPMAPSFIDTSNAGEPAVRTGPALSNAASLPVDATGQGTIQGAPTGEATTDETRGDFTLVLAPAPAGLAPRTTVEVGFDRSTKVYRNGQYVGDAFTALNSDGGHVDADPTSAGTVVVRFHVKDGRPFADRLDLSDDYPAGIEP
jgi:hypothetical protein